MKSIRWFGILLVGFFIISCGGGVTYSIYLRYQPSKDFPGLQQKMGPTLAIAPFKDDRQEKFYVGTHTPLQGSSNFFKSNPFPWRRRFRIL